MKKNLFLLLILTSSFINSQNKEIIKKTFSVNQSIEGIENVAIENGSKKGDNVFLKVFFKSDLNGVIFDISVDNKSKIFESEITKIINKIPKLNPNEYLNKGKEMKYGLKIHIKVSTKKKPRKKTKKKKYKWFYVKEYFPIKWVEIQEIEKKEISKIERIPISENCKNIKGKTEILNCVYKDLKMHVNRKFDVDLAQDLGLPQGKQTLVVSFVISKIGEIVNVEAEGDHELLLEEGIRVINSYPNFYKPGTINGKPVDVKYSIPISFSVVD